MNRTTHLVIGCLLLVGACTVPNDRAVKAIDLTSGETKTFSSESDVPSGWAVCDDPDCSTVPPAVPCQNLGPEVCTLNPQCRLRTLECTQSSCGGVAPAPAPEAPASSDGSGTDSSSGGVDSSADPYPGGGTDGCVPEPPTCNYACVPKDELFCEELKDKSDCLQRPECNWGQVMCPAMGCVAGGDCAVECPESCYADAPPTCGQLDEISCSERTDCQWTPGVCPACAHEDGTSCACQPFCQVKDPGGCPEVAPPPPGYCSDGSIAVQYNDQGCVIGFTCQGTCIEIGPPPPGYCASGEVVPTHDSQGCVVGYECDEDTTHNQTCNQISTAYAASLQAAKGCNAATASPTDCSLQVADNLGCGCSTYVSASNSAAVTKLADLTKQWEALNCQQGIVCPAMACWVPDGATCQPSADGGSVAGTCQDNAL